VNFLIILSRFKIYKKRYLLPLEVAEEGDQPNKEQDHFVWKLIRAIQITTPIDWAALAKVVFAISILLLMGVVC